VAINLRHADARGLILQIVERCDVVVDNFSVGTMGQLGLDVHDLRAVNPAVIVASLTGYGQTGPYARYTAYGPAGGALSGLYAANGYPGGDVAETGIAVGDPALGIAAAWAIVAALVIRRRSGETARVDAAMVEAVAATLGELWMEYLATGESPPRRGNHDVAWAPHNCYPAAGEDHWVTIACPTETTWRQLCSVIGQLADDARFATMASRKEHEDDLDAVIATWTATQDRWDVTRRLQAVGVAAFPSLSPGDLWRGDPHLAAIGMLEQPDHPATGARTIPGVPWRLTDGRNGLRRPAPLIGQHSDEVLRELLDCQPAELDDLRRRGVVA
jgi:crotonobetainyl-CoA:carnitine CoA-transferase CaiB-like acyl-CoA transferase